VPLLRECPLTHPAWAVKVVMSITAARANLISVFIVLISLLEGRSSVPAAFAASFRFVHLNGLHLLHRKRGRVYYKFLRPRIARMSADLPHRKK
jgi:hypothetical protein